MTIISGFYLEEIFWGGGIFCGGKPTASAKHEP